LQLTYQAAPPRGTRLPFRPGPSTMPRALVAEAPGAAIFDTAKRVSVGIQMDLKRQHDNRRQAKMGWTALTILRAQLGRWSQGQTAPGTPRSCGGRRPGAGRRRPSISPAGQGRHPARVRAPGTAGYPARQHAGALPPPDHYRVVGPQGTREWGGQAGHARWKIREKRLTMAKPPLTW
jgi:hypothetical protein